MSPEALSANATETFEDIVPATVTVEIEGDIEYRFEDPIPAVLLVEIGA